MFELSPSFLRAGASMVGQYDERISSLIKVLEANPKVILFVDEVHSLLQSGMHERGPFSEANESFKTAVGRGGVQPHRRNDDWPSIATTSPRTAPWPVASG